MSQTDKIRILHPDGIIHQARTEVRRAADPEGEPWAAISRCGIEFELDESVEPAIAKRMVAGIATDADATCPTCQATP